MLPAHIFLNLFIQLFIFINILSDTEMGYRKCYTILHNIADNTFIEHYVMDTKLLYIWIF